MVADRAKSLFFLGKGGTGKTTISALTALSLSETEKKVALFSIDPAHNLFDIFQLDTSKSSIRLKKNLTIEEIDIQFWIITYLKSIEDKISRTYQHLTALSLEKNLETIRYSPGMEEYALQYAFESVRKKYKEYDYLLFDMPPTALALRFFNLPKLTLVWLKQLIDLRKSILEKKKIINDVHRRDTEKSDDKILNQLYEMKSVNLRQYKSFQNTNSTGIYIVSNEDPLSLSESIDIYTTVLKNEFSVSGILVNKYKEALTAEEIRQKFSKLPVYFFPYADQTLIGESRLKVFMQDETLRSFFNQELSVSNHQ